MLYDKSRKQIVWCLETEEKETQQEQGSIEPC